MKTSTYADAWLALYRVLDESSWPQPPTANDKGVKVYLGVLGKDSPLEAIIVRPEAESALSWAPLGAQSRDEQLEIPVRVATTLRDRTVFDVIDRLKDLTDVVEQTLWDTAQVANHPSELFGRMVWWSVTSMSTVVYVMEAGGCGGYAELTVTLHARLAGGRN